MLLSKEINLDILDNSGDSALGIAVSNGNLKIANLLLENKANPNILNSKMQSSLEIALLKQDIHMITLLLFYGADINLPSRNDNNIPLHESAKKTNNIEIIKLFENKPKCILNVLKRIEQLDRAKKIEKCTTAFKYVAKYLLIQLTLATTALAAVLITGTIYTLGAIALEPLFLPNIILLSVFINAFMNPALTYYYIPEHYGPNDPLCYYYKALNTQAKIFKDAAISYASDVGTSILSILNGRNEEALEVGRG